MIMQQLTLPGEIVKKHNELIRSKINVNSQTASRVLACLVACIRHDDTQFKESYSVPIKKYLRGEGSINKQVREACRELVTATIEAELPCPDDPDDIIFHIMPFFSSIKYTKGTVQAQFNPEMANFLLELKACFTQYNLIEYLKLPSIYSQRIFELLMSWRNIPEVVLPLSELHHLLNTPPSFRSDFKAFRVYALEKAQKDIQKHTTLLFEWKAIKEGRSVTAIKFVFTPARKKLVEVEKQKVDQEKSSEKNNANFLKALDCAKSKNRNCTEKDNKAVLCKLCLKYNFANKS